MRLPLPASSPEAPQVFVCQSRGTEKTASRTPQGCLGSALLRYSFKNPAQNSQVPHAKSKVTEAGGGRWGSHSITSDCTQGSPSHPHETFLCCAEGGIPGRRQPSFPGKESYWLLSGLCILCRNMMGGWGTAGKSPYCESLWTWVRVSSAHITKLSIVAYTYNPSFGKGVRSRKTQEQRGQAAQKEANKNLSLAEDIVSRQ